ncbi:MAG: DUF1048 domain-containing protein [Lachnospiraceae bacterium]|nr:DUF1048 domain-containing protein [Lachnospiraceae bacterium]
MKKSVKNLMRENENLEKEIHNEDSIKALTDIVVYLRGSRISMLDQEKVRKDIVEMLIDGEKRGQDIREIIGDDFKEFCDNVISEIPKKSNLQVMIENFGDVLLGLDMLLFIRLIFVLLSQITNHTFISAFPVRLGEMITGIVILVTAVALVQWICRNSFEGDDAEKDRKYTIIAVFIAMFLTGFCIVMNLFVKVELFMIHPIVIIAIIVLIAILCKVIEYYVK